MTDATRPDPVPDLVEAEGVNAGSAEAETIEEPRGAEPTTDVVGGGDPGAAGDTPETPAQPPEHLTGSADGDSGGPGQQLDVDAG